MPNWVTNTIIVRGKEKNIINFLNYGIKEEENKIKSLEREELDKLNGKLSLRSFIPKEYPFNEEDFALDLANTKMDKVMFLNSEYHKEPREYYKSYEEYSKAYDELKEKQMAARGICGWYDYNCATLGTKWDSYFSYINKVCDDIGDESFISLECETAWCCPDLWLHAVQKKFPDVKINLFCTEESRAFCGYFLHDGTEYFIDTKDYNDVTDMRVHKEDFEDEDDYYCACEEVYDDLEVEVYHKFEDIIYEK